MPCRSLPSSFRPSQREPPWLGPDLQTLRNVLRGPVATPSPGLAPERLTLPLRDGSGDRLAARLWRPEASREAAPLVVLVHGLGGSEDSTYLQVTTTHLLAGGWPVLQLNLRGAGPSRPWCRQQYHAGRTEDFGDAVAALPESLTQHGFFAAGFSLGGNMLLKYAAETGSPGPGLPVLRGVASVSAPIDLAAASRRFLDARNRFYHVYLLNGMKQEALGEGAAISDEERRLVPKLETILEFDEKIVAPRNGYASAAAYYAENHARQFLPAIRVPALVMHALDDPWIPADAYTSFDWSQNRALQPLLPRSGGHVGFHARGSRTPWHDRCLHAFLEAL